MPMTGSHRPGIRRILCTNWHLLAICHPSGCTVASGIVSVVIVGICHRSQMRTSKCKCLSFGVSKSVDPG